MAFSQVNPVDVTIARDSFGVPHIIGKTDADAAYGLARAHAEDNLKISGMFFSQVRECRAKITCSGHLITLHHYTRQIAKAYKRR